MIADDGLVIEEAEEGSGRSSIDNQSSQALFERRGAGE